MARLNPIKVSTGSIADIDNLCSALNITRAELDTALSLPREERYIAKETPKKDGSIRTVYNPHHLLRKIQRRINERIFSNPSVIAWPDHIFGSIPNQEDTYGNEQPKDYISCAKLHCQSKSILTIDIKDFFDNIDESLVTDIFENFLHYDREVSKTISRICCFDNHVVQGGLTSSYIASLCLYDIEGEVVDKLNQKGLIYTRLIDDINISSKISTYDFSYAEKIVENMLTQKGLPINRNKKLIQRISTTPLTVHGLRVSFHNPRLPSDEVRRIRAAVKNIETLASERNYRTTRSYRKDFNRCLGRVNKLKRIGHIQHSNLISRLKKILPLPSKIDLERAKKVIARLERDHPTKGQSFFYKRSYYVAHERLTVLRRTYFATANELQERLKKIKPTFI